MATQIVIFGEVPENPVVVEGFPSSAFVGTISAMHIIKEMNMETIGYVKSDKLLNIALVHDYAPSYPIRIYKKDNIVVLISEIIIPASLISELSKSLMEWFDSIKPKQLISLAGISGRQTTQDHEVFGISTNEKINEKLTQSGIKLINEGTIAGISADILLYAKYNNIDGISLMVETQLLVDPKAAAFIINVLNNILSLNINSEKLLIEGERMEEIFNNLFEEMKEGMKRYKQMEDRGPMYG